MTPILGILASQNSGHLWAPQGAYDALATATPNGTTGTITFAGIPSGYKHLQLRMILRGSSSYAANGNQMWFNGDSGANYTLHTLYGTGSGSAASNGYTGVTGGWQIEVDSTTASNIFAGSIVDILDYSSTTKNKTLRTLTGYDANGSGQFSFASGVWLNTSAINRIDIVAAFSGNWVAGTQVALYGVK